MLDKLRDVRLRYDEVNRRLQDPATVSDNKLFRDLMREYKNLTPLIEAMDEYEQAQEACREAKELLDEGGLEPDFKEMVQQQLTENKEKLEPLEQKLKLLLLPVVMGISYELIKLAGRYDNLATRIISAPGLWLQRLTTFEPDDSMIEVAIAAVKPVLPERPEEGLW